VFSTYRRAVKIAAVKTYQSNDAVLSLIVNHTLDTLDTCELRTKRTKHWPRPRKTGWTLSGVFKHDRGRLTVGVVQMREKRQRHDPRTTSDRLRLSRRATGCYQSRQASSVFSVRLRVSRTRLRHPPPPPLPLPLTLRPTTGIGSASNTPERDRVLAKRPRRARTTNSTSQQISSSINGKKSYPISPLDSGEFRARIDRTR